MTEREKPKASKRGRQMHRRGWGRKVGKGKNATRQGLWKQTDNKSLG